MRTVRIFISSPGDSEREQATEVIEALKPAYADVLKIQTVPWEEVPFTKETSIPPGVDLLTPSQCVIEMPGKAAHSCSSGKVAV